MTRWLKVAQSVGWAPTKQTKPTKSDTDADALSAENVDRAMHAQSVERDHKSFYSPILSVLSVLSGGGDAVLADHAKASSSLDTEELAALLKQQPMTYGSAAATLGWGATRAWQAEARLRAAGLLYFDKLGRAHLKGVGRLP